jgi:hypothetical protein
MSQRNRIVFATLVLATALCLAAPAPSHAAGLRPWNIPVMDAWGRAWNWMAGLLPNGASRKPRARQEKEGGALDPNGHAGLIVPPPAPTTSNGGGALSSGSGK